MAFSLFWRSALAAIVTAVAAKAGAVVPGKELGSPSVADRVAAIRAKAAELSAAHSHDAAATPVGRPAQVAWNDWKNE
jgi:hypothetical protein